MQLVRSAQAMSLQACPEDWTYVGNCPLPVCNPGGCADGAPLREYVYCRLNLYAPGFAASWRGGDILFMGDSNTDVATAYGISPVLPRGFNASVLGSRICDVNVSVGIVQGWINALAAANPGVDYSPGSLVLMVGTNDLIRDVNHVDNTFTPATAAMYQQLFTRLDQFRAANNLCDIIVRSVLPGIPVASSCCTDTYIPDVAAYRNAVLDANAFLKQVCRQHDFYFLNDHKNYWDNPAHTVRVPLYRNGDNVHPCTHATFPDQIHLGCAGQRVALTNVAEVVYAKSNKQKGDIASLVRPPFAAPLKSGLPLDQAAMYRYVRRQLNPGKQLTLTSKGSSYNYAAIFQPGQVGGLPVAEGLHTTGADVTVSVTNSTGQQQIMVACVGTHPGNPGQYKFG